MRFDSSSSQIDSSQYEILIKNKNSTKCPIDSVAFFLWSKQLQILKLLKDLINLKYINFMLCFGKLFDFL